MPPHLHPRSRMTTSLFTTTLMISFLVVATPHFLPCPVDPRTLADSADPTALSGDRRQRKRKVQGEKPCGDEQAYLPKRECPVPKPGGLIGQVLGIKGGVADGNQPPPSSVAVQVSSARWKNRAQENE